MIFYKKPTTFFTVLLIAACLFSGCLSDPIIGSWSGTETETIIIFDSAKTYQVEIGLFKTSGEWEKSGDVYALYYDGIRVGTAEFEGNKLHVEFGSGLLSVSENFVKQ
ncbi:hypothetical protein MmiHf6_10270 [Methanimicrococcus hongohii]|uniref:DUF5640 domain-containing protein n=1 Tax=Methanimicrococcus hongohii TaxID=3028295 RepID=A0AA96V0V1_9EURY|nr:hypothetical protein [Methanimicrococcus sp. Hf6]WNY23713.1 hypothetical protein MmiHf6_10270 [Methanimicrococcus sp. Hf6]